MSKNLTAPSTIDLTYGHNSYNVKAVNSPKLAPSAIAIAAITKLVGGNNLSDGKYTPFGHLAKSQGGMIDNNILAGHTTLNGLVLGLSGASTRKSDPLAYGKSCKRVADHLKWMATQAESHDGLAARLKNVCKNPKTLAKKLASPLTILNETIQASFKAQYNAKGVPLA